MIRDDLYNYFEMSQLKDSDSNYLHDYRARCTSGLRSKRLYPFAKEAFFYKISLLFCFLIRT